MKYNSTKNNMKLLLFVLTVLGSSNAQLNTRCNTPNGELANCISIRDCQILLDAVLVRNRPEQQTQFLQASSCGSLGKLPLVCCGTRNNYGLVRTAPVATTEATLNWNALPSRERCGKQVSGSRILGGQKAGLEEFPWMALLEYRGRSGASTGHSCGGVLINSRYVLTAAHCIVGEVTRQVGQVFQVRLGEYDVNTAIDCTPDSGCADSPLDIPVEERIAHNEYNDNSIDRYHDIGLLRLSRDAPYTSFIRPICLPTVKDTDVTVPGEKLFVAGWGRMENNSYSPVKLKLAVPVVELTSCVTKFRNTGATVSSRQLCAGGELGKDSCRGDSGGPLMNTVRGSSNQWYVEGIVSFGVKCGTQDMPGVYTKVSEYMTWILTHIRN